MQLEVLMSVRVSSQLGLVTDIHDVDSAGAAAMCNN